MLDFFINLLGVLAFLVCWVFLAIALHGCVQCLIREAVRAEFREQDERRREREEREREQEEHLRRLREIRAGT